MTEEEEQWFEGFKALKKIEPTLGSLNLLANNLEALRQDLRLVNDFGRETAKEIKDAAGTLAYAQEKTLPPWWMTWLRAAAFVAAGGAAGYLGVAVATDRDLSHPPVTEAECEKAGGIVVPARPWQSATAKGVVTYETPKTCQFVMTPSPPPVVNPIKK